jgi:hypothetical protein
MIALRGYGLAGCRKGARSRVPAVRSIILNYSLQPSGRGCARTRIDDHQFHENGNVMWQSNSVSPSGWKTALRKIKVNGIVFLEKDYCTQSREIWLSLPIFLAFRIARSL